jgi:hypothetical protein
MPDIDYGVYGDLVHPDIKNTLKTRRHPLGENNAYPVVHQLSDGNFEQQCAKKRFSDVVRKYQEATNTVDTEPRRFADYVLHNAIIHAFKGVQMSEKMERPHYRSLEKLAVDIVCKDFNIKEGDVIFNVKLVGMGNVKFPPEMKTDKEEMMEPPDITENNFEYDIDDEFRNASLSMR